MQSPPPRPLRTGVVLYDAPVYPHTSTFQSNNLELAVRSPRIRYVDDYRYAGHSIPVFDGKDSVGGTVTTIVPLSFPSPYHLVISFEGAFFWIAPQKEHPQSFPLTPPPKRIKHTFLSSTITIPVLLPPRPPPRYISIRSTIRGTLLRNPHRLPPPRQPPFPVTTKSLHSFTFQLPHPANRQLPDTLSVSRLQPGGLRGRWYAEGAQLAYKVTAQLCSGHDSQTFAQLEAPVLIDTPTHHQPPTRPPEEIWSQSTLTSLQPLTLPFQCLLFLPHTPSFPRTATIPFCIAFTTGQTGPRSVELALKIVKDASVQVKLVREICLSRGVTFEAPVPRTRQDERLDEERRDRDRESARAPSRRTSLIHRVATNASNLFRWRKRRGVRSSAYPQQQEDVGGREKPLPPIPGPGPAQESQVRRYEDVICFGRMDGFKRCVPPGGAVNAKPALSSKSAGAASLSSSVGGSTKPAADSSSVSAQWTIDDRPPPDGFVRGELELRNELANTIEWPGLSLTYFVEATVMLEQEVLSTRRRICIDEPYHDRERGV